MPTADHQEKLFKEVMRLHSKRMNASATLLAKRFLEDNPNRAMAWLYYGGSLTELSRYKQATSALRRAARLTPSRHLYLVDYYFAKLHERNGNSRIVIQWYRRSIQNCPTNTPAYLSLHAHLGTALSIAGRLREAEMILRRALRVKTGIREEVLLNLGLTLVGLGQYRKGRRCYLRALDIDPKYKLARQALIDVEYVLENKLA